LPILPAIIALVIEFPLRTPFLVTEITFERPFAIDAGASQTLIRQLTE